MAFLLSLALLVLGILADHAYHTAAADDLTLVTAALD
jgi:hypothetical protein